MTQYHINPDTGRPNQCYAKIQCRFGSADEHYNSKEDARAGYEKSMEGKTLNEGLQKTSRKVKELPSSNPIIPGVPAVQTQLELDEELRDLQREGLYGNRLKDVLRSRGVGIEDIEDAENNGDYIVDVKVPSYYEIDVSTDLARRELGLPARKPTGIDQHPVRISQIKMDESYSKTRGEFKSLKEITEVNNRYKEDKLAYENLKAESKLKKDSD